MVEGFRRQQLITGLGAFCGGIVAVTVLLNARPLFGGLALPPDDTASRLALVVRWLLLPGVTLAAGVQVAARRGFLPGAIDGTRTPANRALEINLRYNQNTLEQTVLAAIAWAGLAIALPPG